MRGKFSDNCAFFVNVFQFCMLIDAVGERYVGMSHVWFALSISWEQ